LTGFHKSCLEYARTSVADFTGQMTLTGWRVVPKQSLGVIRLVPVSLDGTITLRTPVQWGDEFDLTTPIQ
jgi:hypothetical protein